MMLLKMNQLSYAIGVARYFDQDGDDVPNKKFYDPRVWLREGEKSFIDRLKQAFEDLNNVNTL